MSATPALPWANVKKYKSAVRRKTGDGFDIPVARIRPYGRNPRKYFDEDAIAATAKSLKDTGQHDPITVIPIDDDPAYDFELVDGERRHRASKPAGMTTLWALIELVNNDEEHYALSVARNFGQEAHTPLEIVEIVRNLRGDGKTIEQIAAICGGKTTMYISQFSLVGDRFCPELLPLLGPPTPEVDRISISVAYKMSQVSVHHQRAIYEKHKHNGRLSVATVAREVDQLREAHGPIKRRKRKGSDVADALAAFAKGAAAKLNFYATDPHLPKVNTAPLKDTRADILKSLAKIQSTTTRLARGLGAKPDGKKHSRIDLTNTTVPITWVGLMEFIEWANEHMHDFLQDPDTRRIFADEKGNTVVFAREYIGDLVKRLLKLLTILPTLEDTTLYIPEFERAEDDEDEAEDAKLLAEDLAVLSKITAKTNDDHK